MIRPVLVLYHAKCLDGFGAAWAAHRGLETAGPVEYRAMSYGDPIPTDEELKDAYVYVLDFSFPPEVMAHIAHTAYRLVWLDHHKTAAEYLPEFERLTRGLETIYFSINMAHSGAVLTWQHFFGMQTPVPCILRRVEDRDLWQFKYHDTRAICAALYSYPFEFDLWTDCTNPAAVDQLRQEGNAILRQHDKYVEAVIEAARPAENFLKLGDAIGPWVNAPGFLASDVGHTLLKMMDEGLIPQGDYAATYFDTPTERIFSLRSVDHRADVSALAKQYGGGGHRNAAGFKLPHQD